MDLTVESLAGDLAAHSVSIEEIGEIWRRSDGVLISGSNGAKRRKAIIFTDKRVDKGRE